MKTITKKEIISRIEEIIDDGGHCLCGSFEYCERCSPTQRAHESGINSANSSGR